MAAASAQSFESMKIWKIVLLQKEVKKECELTIYTESSLLCSLASPHSILIIPGLHGCQHQSLRSDPQFYRPRNSNMSTYTELNRLLEVLPQRRVWERGKLGGCFLLAVWYKGVYSGSHSFSPKDKRLAQIDKEWLRQNWHPIIVAKSV